MSNLQGPQSSLAAQGAGCCVTVRNRAKGNTGKPAIASSVGICRLIVIVRMTLQSTEHQHFLTSTPDLSSRDSEWIGHAIARDLQRNKSLIDQKAAELVGTPLIYVNYRVFPVVLKVAKLDARQIFWRVRGLKNPYDDDNDGRDFNNHSTPSENSDDRTDADNLADIVTEELRARAAQRGKDCAVIHVELPGYLTVMTGIVNIGHHSDGHSLESTYGIAWEHST